jgi:nitrilase
VAAVQAAPIFLDRAATVEKCCTLIRQAAAEGARLIVFPEAFIPTYPLWVWHIAAGQTHALRELYAELLDQSVSLESEAVRTLCAAARETGTQLVVGINEKNDEASSTSLYNTLLYIGHDGRVLGRHRKLVPTAGERLVHAPGDGSTLEVLDTPVGRLSGLVCWENYMPLARYALYAWGVQIYVAPTWDWGEPWLSTLRHIAKEGRVYVIGCCTALQHADIPERYSVRKLLPSQDWINPGDSAIVNPDGKVVAGPAHEVETILYADLDPTQLRGPRWQLDVAGHYARPDVFQLTIDRSERPVVRMGEARPADTTQNGEPVQLMPLM